MYQEKFDEYEWMLLKYLYAQIVAMVAGADGWADNKELSIVQNEIANPHLIKNILHRELASEIDKYYINELMYKSSDPKDILDIRYEAKRIMQLKLTDIEYQEFVGSLFITGMAVAQASGRGILGNKNPYCEKEILVLHDFATFFNIDPNLGR